MFVRARWPILLLILFASAVALAVSAGQASSRDDLGRFTRYGISIGTDGMEASTGIYGWYYSLPSLVMLMVLAAATASAWLTIPRPAWLDEVDADALERRVRAANIGRTACAAILVHLAVILQSLSSTASLVGSMETSDIGTVTVGASFAAIGPALYWSGTIAFAAGLALWLIVVLSAVPLPIRRRTITARS